MSHLFLSAIGDWGQLIFVLVALVGWIIKTVVEAREEKSKQGAARQKKKPEEQRSRVRKGLEATAKAFAEGFLETEPQSGPQAGQQPGQRSSRRPQPPERTPTPIELGPPSQQRRRAGRALVGAEIGEDHTTETVGDRTFVRLKETTGAAVVQRTPEEVRRHRALRRLGIAPHESHQALRRAILWSEVIGMPRYARGPHCSPAAERLRSKR